MVLGITRSDNNSQYVPYWHRSSAIDEKLQQIIADLTAFLEERVEAPAHLGVDLSDDEPWEGYA